MMKMELLKEYGVDLNSALDFWGDEISYEESLKEFKDSLPDKLESLINYKNNNDYENYGILAHSIKSECKYLGFQKESQIFLEHEQAGKNSDEEFISTNYYQLEETINKIVDILNKYFQDNNSYKNILIADDSNIIINFIENNIKDEYKVIRANNGEDAINYIKNNDLYAILLDLNMPNINGFEVLDYMKENKLLNRIPVVVITGDNTSETVKKAFTYPIIDVLNKPFNEDNIKRILNSIDSFYDEK